jgi:hypothetical protein
MIVSDEFKNAVEQMTPCHPSFKAAYATLNILGEFRRSLNKPTRAQSYTTALWTRRSLLNKETNWDPKASASTVAKSLYKNTLQNHKNT